MSKMQRWFAAALLVSSACAPAGTDEGDGISSEDVISGLASAEQALCPVGEICDPAGDGDDSETPQLSVGLTYDEANKSVKITWSNVPANVAVTISSLQSIDWSCSAGPMPTPKTVLTTIPANSNIKSFVDDNVPDDARLFYYVSYKQDGATIEGLNTIDTDIDINRSTGKFQVSSVGKSWVSLRWKDTFISDDYFALERKNEGSNTFTEIMKTPSNHNVTCQQFAFKDSGRTPGKTYCYRVRIHTGLGHTGYTHVECANTLAP